MRSNTLPASQHTRRGSLLRQTAILLAFAITFPLLTACGEESEANWDGACDPTIAGSSEALDADKLAWLSDQIVVGTVIDVPPPYATSTPGDSSPPTNPIAVLQVESRVRGEPADTLHLFACQFDYPGWILLEVGDRLLAYLTEIRQVEGKPIYAFLGEQQGLWRITSREQVLSPVPWIPNAPLADMLANVRAELVDEPTDSARRHAGFVSLEDAPLVEP